MRILLLDRLVAGGAVFALLVAACSDADEPVREVFAEGAEPTDATTTLLPPTPTDPPEAPRPVLGEMEVPCGLVDGPIAVSADLIGIDDLSILIGTGNDRGGLHTPGSGRGIPDAVEVMAGYCNSLGGLAGRDVLVSEYDAAAVEAVERAAEQCVEVMSAVGYGYLDEAGAQAERGPCALPSYPAWPDGLIAGEPFPIHGPALSFFLEPPAGSVALVGPATSTGAGLRSRRRAALETSDVPFSVVADIGYAIGVDPGWDSVAAGALAAEAGLVWVDGSCTAAITPFLRAAAALDWSPAVLGGPSAYDSECVAAAAVEGLGIDRLTVELPFLPLEDGPVAAPVTAAFAELLAEVAAPITGDALLASSAYWRWAFAVDECGQGLSRSCLGEAASLTAGWTAGGLHRPYDFDGTTDACAVVVGVVDAMFVRQLPEIPGTYDCAAERSVVLRSIG